MNMLLNNEKILADILTQYGIKHVVVADSAKTSALNEYAAQKKCYNLYRAIDERNASYYALGLALESREPVAVVCSSNMAAANYLPAIAEAYYQKLPVLFIAENPLGEGHCEEPIAPTFGNVTRDTLHLPKVSDEARERKNIVEINRAVQNLTLHGTAPVFLSYDAAGATGCEKEAPKIPCIERNRNAAMWQEKIAKLENASAVAVVLESGANVSCEVLRAFAEKFDCLVIEATTSQVRYEDAINLNTLLSGKWCDIECPEYVITISDEVNSKLPVLFQQAGNVKHWHVAPSGKYYDILGRLDTVFAIEPNEFFAYLVGNTNCSKAEKYRSHTIKDTMAQTKNLADEILTEMAQHMTEGVVQNSCAVTQNVFDTVTWNRAVLLHSTVDMATNIGCVSVFLGMARHEKRLCYLIIDDVSFYNDMNALMLRDIGSNIRILLVNTGKVYQTAYTGAASDHFSGLRSWAEDAGFDYYAADGDQATMANFLSDKGTAPVILEMML